MVKTYRCEYCGQKIRTEVCRYCGAINSFKQEAPEPLQTPENPSNTDTLERREYTDAESVKNSETKSTKNTTETTGKKTNSLQKTRKKSQKNGLSLNAYNHDSLKSTSRNKHHNPAVIVLIACSVLLVVLLAFVLHDADIVWDIKKNTKSETVIECESSVDLTITHSDITETISLPCRVSEISSKYKIINPTIVNPERNDPDGDGILDLTHYDSCVVSDSYGIFSFYVTNDSDETVPFLNGVCKTLASGDHFRNCSSLKFNGTELISDIEAIIDSLGEPSKSEHSTIFDTYTYNTTHGSITLKYYEEKDHDRPNHIEIRQDK